MHRLVNVLLSGVAALTIGAGAVRAEAPKPSRLIGINPCDDETYECKARTGVENGEEILSALRAEFAAAPMCAGLSFGHSYVDSEELWVLWLAFGPGRTQRTWTLKPPDNTPWFKGEGTIREIVETVCGIANGRGGNIID